MSLPITAGGPLKVETKPILMVSPADAGCASASAVTPASQNAVFIFTPLIKCRTSPAQPGGGQRLSRAPFVVRCFVREIPSRQQARTAGSLLEPSAHTPAACTIIRRWRGWQEL